MKEAREGQLEREGDDREQWNQARELLEQQRTRMRQKGQIIIGAASFQLTVEW